MLFRSWTPRLRLLLLLACAQLNCQVFAQFQILPDGTVANSTLADISDACIAALQGTVQCNSSLESIAAADYFFDLDDSSSTFASLCAPSCGTSLAQYHNSVETACAGQPEAWSGYPATYFGDLMWASWNLTCLTDPTTGNSCISYFVNISAAYTDDVSATSLPKAELCSPCVLSLYRLMQGTAYSNYDANMAIDWANIQSQCGVSYPTTVQSNPTNVTSIAGYAPANYSTASVCYSDSTYLVVSGDNCVAISQKLSVSTGALISMNNLLPDCSNLAAGATLCLPQSCTTYTVKSGDTCAAITNASSITFTQFSAWNPTINSYCTNLVAGQEVCVGQPGPTYNGTTIAGATVTQTAVYATATIQPPSNIALDTTTQCGKYYTVQSGDDCSLIALNNTIAITLFESINPSINADCTNLVPGLSYCVFPTADWNSTSDTSTTTTATYVSAPTATPSGTSSNCYEWHVVVSGDFCALIESEYGITMAQLQLWNPSLNDACTNLILGDAYCVNGQVATSGQTTSSSSSSSNSIPTSTTKPPASSTVLIPGPTQSGIVSGCTAYYLVKSGDSCSAIESEYNITFAEFLAWNPAIGSNCQFLDVGDAYCVSIS